MRQREEESAMDTKTRQPDAETESPVDDATYNLLQALTSKLEAIEAYEIYAQDDPQGVFGGLLEEERGHASRLLDALRGQLSNA
jgi:rubrerythrin